MALKLIDFSKESLKHRIENASRFCTLNYYNVQRYDFGVVKISYSVSFNAIGHMVFGPLTLGYASICAERNDIKESFFDCETHTFIGNNFEEVKKHFYLLGEECFMKSDFVQAANAFYKAIGASSDNNWTEGYRLEDISSQMIAATKYVKNANFLAAMDIVNEQLSTYSADIGVEKQIVLQQWNVGIAALLKTQNNINNGVFEIHPQLNLEFDFSVFKFWNDAFQNIILAFKYLERFEWTECQHVFSTLKHDSHYWDNATMLQIVDEGFNLIEILLRMRTYIENSNYDDASIDVNEAICYQKRFTCFSKVNLTEIEIVLDILKNILHYTSTFESVIKELESPKMEFLTKNDRINEMFRKERLLLESFFQVYYNLVSSGDLKAEATCGAIQNFREVTSEMADSILIEQLKRCIDSLLDKK